MNCAVWEDRILRHLEGEPDAEAAEHLSVCPFCAALAGELAADGRRLRGLPPEADAVDYEALRAAARRVAGRIRWRRRVLAGLGVAAALLLAWRLPVQRHVPETAQRHAVPAPAPSAPAVSETPRMPLAAARHSRRKPRPDALDRQFAEFLRSQGEARRGVAPAPSETTPLVRIATTNPNVIIWLQEGEEHE